MCNRNQCDKGKVSMEGHKTVQVYHYNGNLIKKAGPRVAARRGSSHPTRSDPRLAMRRNPTLSVKLCWDNIWHAKPNSQKWAKPSFTVNKIGLTAVNYNLRTENYSWCLSISHICKRFKSVNYNYTKNNHLRSQNIVYLIKNTFAIVTLWLLTINYS